MKDDDERPFAAARLACPVCGAELTVSGGALGCPHGHRFDVARQGYVSLLGGRGSAHRSDTADMVAARTRVFDSGAYRPITEAVARAVAGASAPATRADAAADGVVVDGGGGTGHYLAAVLDAVPDAVGVSVDLSKFCARSAARIHPRAVSVVADLWAGVPVLSGAARALLSVFAPRNADEAARILAPGGRWVIVTPEPGHLAEIVEPMGMLRVGDGKSERLAADLAGRFAAPSSQRVTASVALDAGLVADVAGMGPAGFHRTRAELADAAAAVTARGPARVTLDVTVTLAHRLAD